MGKDSIDDEVRDGDEAMIPRYFRPQLRPKRLR